MDDLHVIQRAKSLIARHGETWTDPRSGCEYSTLEVETVDSPPSTCISLNASDGSLVVVEDDTVLCHFDASGRLAKGDEQKAFPFLARLLDRFEQMQQESGET